MKKKRQYRALWIDDSNWTTPSLILGEQIRLENRRHGYYKCYFYHEKPMFISHLCDNGLLALRMPLESDNYNGEASDKSGGLFETTSKCVRLYSKLDDEITPLKIEAQGKCLRKHPSNGPACILIKVTSKGLNTGNVEEATYDIHEHLVEVMPTIMRMIKESTKTCPSQQKKPTFYPKKKGGNSVS